MLRWCCNVRDVAPCHGSWSYGSCMYIRWYAMEYVMGSMPWIVYGLWWSVRDVVSETARPNCYLCCYGENSHITSMAVGAESVGPIRRARSHHTANTAPTDPEPPKKTPAQIANDPKVPPTRPINPAAIPPGVETRHVRTRAPAPSKIISINLRNTTRPHATAAPNWCFPTQFLPRSAQLLFALQVPRPVWSYHDTPRAPLSPVPASAVNRDRQP